MHGDHGGPQAAWTTPSARGATDGDATVGLWERTLGGAPDRREARRSQRRVERVLRQLRADWRVVHGLRLPTGRVVDHLVVGPGGVFCLARAVLPRRSRVAIQGRHVLVDGVATDLAAEVRAEAWTVAAQLQAALGAPASARPVLVLAGVEARRVDLVDRPADVGVVHVRGLAGWLDRRPRVLLQEQVERLVRVVDDPRTWRAEPAEEDAGVLALADHARRTAEGPRTVTEPEEAPPAAEDGGAAHHDAQAGGGAAEEAGVTPEVWTTEAADDDGCTVVSWQRGRERRRYVMEAATGRRLGWRDEATGEVHVTEGVDPRRVRAALGRWPPGVRGRRRVRRRAGRPPC